MDRSQSQAKEEVKSRLNSLMEGMVFPAVPFLFSPVRPGYRDPAALKEQFHREWQSGSEKLAEAEWLKVKRIFAPLRPHDLKVVTTLGLLDDFSPDWDSRIVQDLGIVHILRSIIADHQISPQLFIELLNYYNRRLPEFLISVDPLLEIILQKGHPALRQTVKTKTCAVLINHYEIEALIIYVSCHKGFNGEEKQTLFQSLTAFQKIYRKFLEVQERIGNKDLISMNWFGEDFDSLKKREEFRDDLSALVGHLLDLLRGGAGEEALRMGRFLVLRFNNEDILRCLHDQMAAEGIENDRPLQETMFHRIYSIMQEFRGEYISRQLDSDLTRFVSDMEIQSFDSIRPIAAGETPPRIMRRGWFKQSPQPQTHPLHAPLRKKLQQYNLTHLFDLYPVPPHAQKILSHISRIAEHLALANEDLVKFIFYLEKLLIFLQQMEEMEITILQGTHYGIIVNPFQMSSLSLIEEGAYFASTGYWFGGTVSPGIIRCINPRAVPNCLGVLDRHIFSRISLLTGAFCGAPFDLDSTNRYEWDEEPETCQIRPGYFLIDIPANLTRSWEKAQALQGEDIKVKISRKNWI